MYNLSTWEVEPEDPYPGHILGSLPHNNKNEMKNEMPIVSFYFTHVFCLHDACILYAPARGSQKRALNPLELESQMILSHNLGAGN